MELTFSIQCFRVIGFAKEFAHETAYEEIPAYWDEICAKYAANACEKALMDNCIGECGVCINDVKRAGEGKFLYMIACKYAGGEVSDGNDAV